MGGQATLIYIHTYHLSSLRVHYLCSTHTHTVLYLTLYIVHACTVSQKISCLGTIPTTVDLIIMLE